ncbi:hypothetical protein C3L33_01796, partial [Rhododendron williamsianum]
MTVGYADVADCSKWFVLEKELFEGYYFYQAQREDFFQRAKPYKGHPTILRMEKLAKELGVVIPFSFFEEANNAHYNSIAIIDVDGADLGLYRKSHIPDGLGYQEKFYFNPGDTGFKQFAVISGFQRQFELWFSKVQKPQDTGLDSRDHWKRVMQGHAGGNLVSSIFWQVNTY